MNVTTTHLRNKFGQCLGVLLKEPIIVEKQGKPLAVVISYGDYERFREIEDAIWANRALAKEADGHFLGEQSLQELLHLKTARETKRKRIADKFIPPPSLTFPLERNKPYCALRS